MPFGKSKGYCNQGAELLKANEKLERYRSALLEIKDRLTPIQLLSENERKMQQIVDDALSA